MAEVGFDQSEIQMIEEIAAKMAKRVNVVYVSNTSKRCLFEASTDRRISTDATGHSNSTNSVAMQPVCIFTN